MKHTQNSNLRPVKAVKSIKVVKTKALPILAVTHNPISLATGLTMVLVDGAVDSEVARQVMAQQVMKGGADLGIQFPKPKVVRTWHAGGERNKAHIEAANNAYPEPPAGVKRFVRCIEVDHRFNWLSDAGWMAVAKAITGTDKQSAQGDWNIILQNGAALEDTGIMHALFKLRQAAMTAGNHVMIVIVGVNKLQDAAEKFFSICEEVITVEACEADPDTHCAVKIAVPSLQHNHQFGKGVIMASLVRGHEKFKIKVDPFIAVEFKQRVAWRLSCAGKTLGEIGESLGVNKSSVSRWLQKMPPVKKADLTEEEIDQALEAIECFPTEEKTAPSRADLSVQHAG